MITSDEKTSKTVLEVVTELVSQRETRVTVCRVPSPPVAEEAWGHKMREMRETLTIH